MTKKSIAELKLYLDFINDPAPVKSKCVRDGYFLHILFLFLLFLPFTSIAFCLFFPLPPPFFS